jgi:HEAT repeat protein
MPFLIEHITQVVFGILVILILGNGVLIGMAITRRQRREKYFHRVDSIRKEFRPVITALLSKEKDYSEGLAALKTIGGFDRMENLERLVLEQKPSAEQIPILSKLAEDLGLVKYWQSRLTGRIDPTLLREGLIRPKGFIERLARLSFLIRAQSAENLGFIRHQPSWPLLVEALDDPHPDLQSVAARSLAVIREPQSFKPLIDRLHRVLLDRASVLSLRSVKSALVGFPLAHAPQLKASLQHPNRRIRFLATDIIREMVERESGDEEDFILERKIFEAELVEIFLTLLPFDENPDVRARSAPVVGYIPDGRSTAVLLTLLQDGEWFVRLHAIRTLAKRKFLTQANRVSEALTDPHWMVREAAARALLVFGRGGVDQLTEHFLATNDRYSREQIADEMQRAGLIPAVLDQFAATADSRAGQVLDFLTSMGKTSYLVTYLSRSADHTLQRKFIESFGQRPDPQIRVWVRKVSRESTDPTLQTMALAVLGSSSEVEEI